MKKIRFPLKLADGIEVRSLEELREHFDLQAVLEHYKTGKLLTWLEDRYLESEAEAVRTLDESASDFQQRFCEIFQVEYVGTDVDMEEIERRQRRLKRLRTVTDETEFISNIDYVAFDQEELAELLDEEASKIYLCGKKFIVPASRRGVTYVGINTPAVQVSGKIPNNPDELGITFVNVQCDSLPQPAVRSTTAKKDRSVDCKEIPFDIMLRFVHMPHSEHYFLHYEMAFDGQAGEEVQVWYKYGLPDGKKSSLPQDVLNILRNEEWYDCDDWNCLSCEDELCIRNDREEIWSLIDLQSDHVIYTQDDFSGKWLTAFDSKYLVLYSSKEEALEIFDRCEPERKRILQVKEDSNYQNKLFLNKSAVGRNIASLSELCGLVDGRLYFVVEHEKDGNSWLACFHLDTELFHFVAALEEDPGDAKIIGNTEYIYLMDSSVISAVNLRTRGVCTFEVAAPITGQQTDYTVFITDDSICMIELANCGMKEYSAERLDELERSNEIDMKDIKDMIFWGSAVYFYNKDESAKKGKRVGFRLDLANETIRLEKFWF
ncbi:MAG: hypothetical protein K2O18_07900 [Oscillospiraceae bacterium]|nr:hypothetical protein [Oscillospiraceae bacterium]